MRVPPAVTERFPVQIRERGVHGEPASSKRSILRLSAPEPKNRQVVVDPGAGIILCGNMYLNKEAFNSPMEYRLSVLVSKEENWYVARGVEIELASQGKSIEEAVSNLREAFELWLKHAEPDEMEVFKRTDSPIVTQVAVAG